MASGHQRNADVHFQGGQVLFSGLRARRGLPSASQQRDARQKGLGRARCSGRWLADSTLIFCSTHVCMTSGAIGYSRRIEGHRRKTPGKPQSGSRLATRRMPARFVRRLSHLCSRRCCPNNPSRIRFQQFLQAVEKWNLVGMEEFARLVDLDEFRPIDFPRCTRGIGIGRRAGPAKTIMNLLAALAIEN